jgi:hypothetical protein
MRGDPLRCVRRRVGRLAAERATTEWACLPGCPGPLTVLCDPVGGDFATAEEVPPCPDECPHYGASPRVGGLPRCVVERPTPGPGGGPA